MFYQQPRHVGDRLLWVWTIAVLLSGVGAASSEWITSLLSLTNDAAKRVGWTGDDADLTKRQSQIATENAELMPYVLRGVQQAIEECQRQFVNETWNCTWTHANALEELTPETAFVHAIVSGGISHSLATACAENANLTACGCAQLTNNASDAFVWDGCSHNLKFAHNFSLSFVEAAWKDDIKTVETLVRSRNSAVGRKVLSSRMRTECRCNGFLGACKEGDRIKKLCKQVVPPFDAYATVLKEKYTAAKKLNLTHNLRNFPVRDRDLRSRIFADVSPRALVHLDDSPDYCTASDEKGIPGTGGRECHSTEACEKVCCGRGWDTRTETRTEQCNCKFIMCCRVECEECVKNVTRMFCR